VKRFVLLLAVLTAACSSSANDHPADTTDSTVPSDAGADTGPAAETDPDTATDDVADAPPDAITVPPSNAIWHAKEDVTFDGKGTGDLGFIKITHGVGTIVFKGETVPAFFYTSTSAPPGTDDAGTFAGDRDFEIVAATPTRLIATWITCHDDVTLTYVYFESTDGPQTSTERSATGTCTIVETPTDEAISLPALALPYPALVTGFTMTGAQIGYDGSAAGTATVAGAATQVYPFHEIDCSKCATPGWWELHALFYDPTSASLSFGILYLAQARPDLVELAFLVRFPEVDNPIGEQLDYTATWTTP
jgi:hypothetical protein